VSNIHIIENVLSDFGRNKLLRESIPHLQKLPKKPGKQSSANLHVQSNMSVFFYIFLLQICRKTNLNFNIHKSWVKWSDGTDPNWHTHDNTADYAAVYYIKTNDSNSGTMFRDGFISAPQNSILLFPANLEHTTPEYDDRFERYIISIDLKLK